MARHASQGYLGVQWAVRLSAVIVSQLLALTGLAGGPAMADSNVFAGIFPAPAGTNADFLDANRAHCRTALNRARRWLDTLEVNPTDLRAHGIKGKKKLAELLDVYLRLYETSAADDKQSLKERIRKITAITASPGYHDMLRVGDRQFKEDSTSYLRVAFLMDRFGLDTGLYRREILKVLPRLNDQMRYRGADQRMAFHLYYKHFGLEEPFPLQAAFRTGVIAARRPVEWFQQRKMEIYSLTHEIFVPYEFGDNLNADFFSAPDKAYLKPLLADLTAFGIGRDDADIVAELTSCLRYLHFTGLPVYRESLQYLLQSQRAEGKWGDYERHRASYGDYVNQAFYLHTTLVVVDALTTAFSY